jgi:hypothetical protein
MNKNTTRRTTTVKHARTLGSLVAAGALLAAPAAGLAAKPATKGKPAPKPSSCKALKAPFQVSGKFVSGVADDVTTPLVNEGSITMTVTSANLHARNSGELTDMNLTKKGIQVKGATYTVTANPDLFTLKINGYEAPDTPSAGDRVKVSGTVALTKKRCAAAGTSTADRYGAVDIKKVTLSDRDADA